MIIEHVVKGFEHVVKSFEHLVKPIVYLKIDFGVLRFYVSHQVRRSHLHGAAVTGALFQPLLA